MKNQIQTVTPTGEVLDWKNLWTDLGLKKDNGGRWYAGDNCLQTVQEYCSQYRSPSRAWPFSHAKPLLTRKFAKHLCSMEPDLAIKLGLGKAI